MCGICGVYSPTSIPDVDLVERMIGAIAHRGPDGSGYFRDHEAALGQARLAVVDVAGGAQPLSGTNDAVWITFNGEIFNYIELADELRQRGHVFRTRSDTEVIVRAWEEWGTDCFRRFNGQWAIAIWDRRTHELVLSRDRFGVNPLYFTRSAGRVLFASEIKALFCDAAVPREFDPVGLDETLTFWSAVAPRTPYRGIEQVAPGEYLIFGPRGERGGRYWSPDFPAARHEPLQSLDESAALLREALIDATRLRFLRSDVPVAAYLSGGIDSTITTAIIRKYTDAALRTFSLRFADAEFDEGHYQALASARFGTQHDEVVVTAPELAAAFPDAVRHAESPLLRTAPAPMLLLARHVRATGHKVVVTGEGADEVFAGYDLFREAKVRGFLARDPSSALRARAVELLYPWMARSPNLAPAFAKQFFARSLDVTDPALSHRPRWDSTSVLKSMLVPELRAERDAASDLISRMPAGSDRWDALSRAQWLEMTTLLPGYVLSSQGDRMLLGASVEGRFPFLDVNVAELASQIAARHKLLGLDEKHVLKKAFADLVPDEILRRPKQPYRSPDAGTIVANDADGWTDDVLSEDAVRTAGIFDPTIVDKLAAKARRAGAAGRPLGNTDDMRLSLVLSTQLLYSEMIVGAGENRSPVPLPLTVHDMTHENEEPS